MDAMESELEHLRSLLSVQNRSNRPTTQTPEQTSTRIAPPINRSTLLSTMSEESRSAVLADDTEDQISVDDPNSMPVRGRFDSLYSNSGMAANANSSLTFGRQPEPQAERVEPGTGSLRTAAKSILPESQPKTSRGYEWNEWQRVSTARADGTASLSIEPDGQGYLGFASGASLLRILQICAGGRNLPMSDLADNHVQDTGIPGFSTTPPTYVPNYDDNNTFVDYYFLVYQAQYPLIHEATFRAQWNDIVPKPALRDWRLLVNVVLAIGAFCQAPNTTHVVDHFMENATGNLGVETLECGSLTLVQGFTLLSNLSQKRNKPNAGSVYLGIAVRMAIGLGLHRELPLWEISPFEREVRRRAWWVLYVFDSGACITFGRPILLPQNEADVNLVLNAHDQALTPSSMVPPQAVDEPTTYSSLRLQSTLHLIGNQAYTKVIASPPPCARELIEIDNTLERWRAGLPVWFELHGHPIDRYPWLPFAVRKLHWRYSNLRIIFNRRPFLERALRNQPLDMPTEGALGVEFEEQICAATCLRSASDSIWSIYAFFSQRPASALEWWYGLHFLFHASFVPLIALHKDPRAQASRAWRDDVAKAIATLELQPDDPLAKRCLTIIRLLSPPPEDAAASEAYQGNVPISMLPGWGTISPMLAGLNTETMSSEELIQTLLPFADVDTLASFWPST